MTGIPNKSTLSRDFRLHSRSECATMVDMEKTEASEAFRQGQRDREQGWPFSANMWGFEGWVYHAYAQGYDHPRVQR